MNDRYGCRDEEEGTRPSREAAGWKRQCLFTRCEDGFIGNTLETGGDFNWPKSRKGVCLLTRSVLGYQEVSSVYAAVITPPEGEAEGFEVEEIVYQVCRLIKGGREIVICPGKSIQSSVGGRHELLVRQFRVQGLVAMFSKAEAGQDEVLTVHLRGMELSNMWYSKLTGADGARIQGHVVSWGQIIYSYAEYRKERVQFVAVISAVSTGEWNPSAGEVNTLVAGAVQSLGLEQPVYSSDIMGFAISSSSPWRFRPSVKTGKVEVYYTYLEERYKDRYSLEPEVREWVPRGVGSSVYTCGMPTWVYPRNGLYTPEGEVIQRRDHPGGWTLVGETRTVSGEVPEGAEIWSKGGYHTNEWSSEERRVEGRPYGGAIVERNCRCSSGGRGDKSVFVFGLCPVCREDVIDEVWGGGQERWDGHLSIRPGTQQRERTATSGCSRETITEGRLQVLAAGSHGHAGVAGGLGSQMAVTCGGGSTGGSCKMGG